MLPFKGKSNTMYADTVDVSGYMEYFCRSCIHLELVMIFDWMWSVWKGLILLQTSSDWHRDVNRTGLAGWKVLTGISSSSHYQWLSDNITGTISSIGAGFHLHKPPSYRCLALVTSSLSTTNIDSTLKDPKFKLIPFTKQQSGYFFFSDSWQKKNSWC